MFGYELLIVVCIFIGFVYGVFFLVGLIIVIMFVLKDKVVSVIVMMFSGMIVVFVVGILFGIFIG